LKNSQATQAKPNEGKKSSLFKPRTFSAESVWSVLPAGGAAAEAAAESMAAIIRRRLHRPGKQFVDQTQGQGTVELLDVSTEHRDDKLLDCFLFEPFFAGDLFAQFALSVAAPPGRWAQKVPFSPDRRSARTLLWPLWR